MNNEKHTISFSFTELYKLLFKKKLCPNCGKPTQRVREKTDKGLGWHKERDDNEINFEYAQKYEHRFVYRCTDCSTEVELKDL